MHFRRRSGDCYAGAPYASADLCADLGAADCAASGFVYAAASFYGNVDAADFGSAHPDAHAARPGSADCDG